MAHAQFRFYAQLNHFLPPEQQKRRFTHTFNWRASVKDMIESLGVPHTEIELIVANGEPVDFSYIVESGDMISVYPPFESLDIGPLLRVSPPPLPSPRFVVDIHLGKLAERLRLLGFDTLRPDKHDDATLARISHDEQRILLTRDTGLLKRNIVEHGCYIRSTRPRQQVIEVLQRYSLIDQIATFSRCIRCNGVLHPVPKSEILDRLPPRTADYYDEFRICDQCDQVYWKGSHYDHMLDFIKDVVPGLDTRQLA